MRSLLILTVLGPLCAGATVRVPDDEATIQAAIDAAVSGDTVLVAAGEYEVTAPVSFAGKDIIVRGEAGPDATTIRMAPAAADPDRESVVLFASGETEAAVLEGFTITGGRGSTLAAGSPGSGGGGIACERGAAPTLRHLRITGNEAENGLAGVDAPGGPPVLTATGETAC